MAGCGDGMRININFMKTLFLERLPKIISEIPRKLWMAVWGGHAAIPLTPALSRGERGKLFQRSTAMRLCHGDGSREFVWAITILFGGFLFLCSGLSAKAWQVAAPTP